MAGPDHAQPGDAQHTDAPVNDAAHQQQAQRDQQQAVNDSLLYPSVGQVNALAMTNRDAPIGQLTQILQQHPEAYDAVMRAIHRHWGNMVAARCAILVPHFSMGAPGARVPLTPNGDETPAAAGGGQADVDVDPITNEHTMSASAGPVTGSVTAQPPNHLTGQGGQVTGGSVEVRGDAGANTNVGGSVGHTTDGTTTASVDATHRVSNNVAVGADASVSADNHGTVTGQGGATVRLHINDVTQLRIHGAVDTQGQLNQEVALEILSAPTPRVPISDDGARRLRFFLRATEPTQTGGQADAAGGGASVQAGIGGTF